MYRRRRRSGVRDDAVRDSRVRDDIELLCGLARRGEGVLRRAALPAGDDLDGERLARLGRVLLAGARRRDHAVDRDAARRGGLRPRVLPRPKPPPRRRGLRAHVARGGPGDAAARRRSGGAGAGAPDSSRGLSNMTLVSYPGVASMAHDLRQKWNGSYHIPRAGENSTSALARFGSVITKQRARGRGSPFPKTRGPATSYASFARHVAPSELRL